MNKITYLCFFILFCFSFKGLSQSSSEIQRVRVDFVSPLGYTRHLLLAFTPDGAATDDFDYGYDAINFDDFPDDLNWMIDDGRYVIQGVGEFNETKYYRFGLFLKNSGEIKIRLASLENFDNAVDVYIYDSVLDKFNPISDLDYINSLPDGNYLDRFYITFSDDTELVNIPSRSRALTISGHEILQTSFNYVRSTKELLIKTNTTNKLSKVSVYDILGKKLLSIENIYSSSIKIPLAKIKTNGSFVVSLLSEDGKQLNKHILAGL